MAEPRRALRGAVIRRKTCESASIAELADRFGDETKASGGWAALLFDRLILWADDDGRFPASPGIVSGRCFPHHPSQHRHVKAYLRAMHDLGLIVLYGEGKRLYGCFPTWSKHQPQRSDRYVPSELPAPPLTPECQPSDVSSETTCKPLPPPPVPTLHIPSLRGDNPQFASANLDPDPERQAILQASIELGDFSKVEPLGVDRAVWDVLRRGWQRSQISPGGEA